jgi:hypothetical protein
MSNAQIATLAVGLPSSSRQASPFLGQFDGFGSGLRVAARDGNPLTSDLTDR